MLWEIPVGNHGMGMTQLTSDSSAGPGGSTVDCSLATTQLLFESPASASRRVLTRYAPPPLASVRRRCFRSG